MTSKRRMRRFGPAFRTRNTSWVWRPNNWLQFTRARAGNSFCESARFETGWRLRAARGERFSTKLRNSGRLARNSRGANAHGDAHMAISDRSLNHLDGAGVINPVAHFILIQSSIGGSRRKVIEAGVEERQIHNEIHRQPLAGSRRRQPHTFVDEV